MKSILKNIILVVAPLLFYFSLLVAGLFSVFAITSDGNAKDMLVVAGGALALSFFCLGALFLARVPVKKALLAGLENTFWFV